MIREPIIFTFGNESGAPGTIITFFPFEGIQQGKVGAGQVGTTAYAIPTGSYEFWKNRLTEKRVVFEEAERFGEKQLVFQDPHGLQIELVERTKVQTAVLKLTGYRPMSPSKGLPERLCCRMIRQIRHVF